MKVLHNCPFSQLSLSLNFISYFGLLKFFGNDHLGGPFFMNFISCFRRLMIQRLRLAAAICISFLFLLILWRFRCFSQGSSLLKIIIAQVRHVHFDPITSRKRAVCPFDKNQRMHLPLSPRKHHPTPKSVSSQFTVHDSRFKL